MYYTKTKNNRLSPAGYVLKNDQDVVHQQNHNLPADISDYL